MKITQIFSILIWANKAKATNDGLLLFARSTVDGKRAEISLKLKVYPNNWDAKAGCLNDKGEDAKATNNLSNKVDGLLGLAYKHLLCALHRGDSFIDLNIIQKIRILQFIIGMDSDSQV